MVQKNIIMIWDINGEGILVNIEILIQWRYKGTGTVWLRLIYLPTVHVVTDLIIKFLKKIEKTLLDVLPQMNLYNHERHVPAEQWQIYVLWNCKHVTERQATTVLFFIFFGGLEWVQQSTLLCLCRPFCIFFEISGFEPRELTWQAGTLPN